MDDPNPSQPGRPAGEGLPIRKYRPMPEDEGEADLIPDVPTDWTGPWGERHPPTNTTTTVPEMLLPCADSITVPEGSVTQVESKLPPPASAPLQAESIPQPSISCMDHENEINDFEMTPTNTDDGEWQVQKGNKRKAQKALPQQKIDPAPQSKLKRQPSSKERKAGKYRVNPLHSLFDSEEASLPILLPAPAGECCKDNLEATPDLLHYAAETIIEAHSVSTGELPDAQPIEIDST
ncbi:hypothetical protein NDU88_002586 [Pleurodeles waltl]|uniref:Uncharacterized protein n=1 Tax=Pleurodeles waltl TaxID=8319 RepID=A0AAV7RAE0_PLEWA|nr:hypothetical protein NDU88_002586 [Pleurodeles waltl]